MKKLKEASAAKMNDTLNIASIEKTILNHFKSLTL